MSTDLYSSLLFKIDFQGPKIWPKGEKKHILEMERDKKNNQGSTYL